MDTDQIDGTEFTLTLKLGNAAMQTPSDIAEALRTVASRLDTAGVYANEIIMDQNGARVGSWAIK